MSVAKHVTKVETVCAAKAEKEKYAEVQAVFRRFDVSGDGYIDRNELSRVLVTLNKEYSIRLAIPHQPNKSTF